jgi:hypothetical protein
VNSDLALPQIEGRRAISVRVGNAYLDRVLCAAETDPAVVQQFLRLINLLDPPSQLMHPSTMLRVAKRSRKPAGAWEADKGELQKRSPGNGAR